MRILIIEDEYISAEQLKGCISAVKKECHFLPFAASIQESLLIVSTIAPDVIFMDIDLSHSEAFDIFRKTTFMLPIIFTTSSTDLHYTGALENTGIRYIVKPFQTDRIEEEFHYIETNRKPDILPLRTSETHGQIDFLQRQMYKSRFLVRQGQKLIPIKTNDINHFSSEGSLVSLTTLDKRKYVIDEPLNELDIVLNPGEFFRVNRKFIIAKDSILSLDYYSKGQVTVKASLLESERIIVSRQQTPLLKTWLSY